MGAPCMRPLLLLLTLFCAHACVENRLTTYMLVQQAGPGVGAETNEKKGRLRLSQTPRELSVFAPDAEALGPLLDRLLGDPSALAGAMAQQEEWLGRTFASGEAWLTELRRWQ